MSTFECGGVKLPEVYVERMKRLFGNEADAFFHAVCAEAPRKGLRLNRCKAHGEKRLLEENGFHVAPLPWEEDGFLIETEDGAGKHPLHAAGLYYLQEPSAMLPVTLLQPHAGERVLDLCAAPGGKSTQIASYLRGEGHLIANEIHGKRAQALSENVERMGIANAVVTNETPEKIAAFFPGYFDAVLVDAPCSGEGMFRKNPEAITEWSTENVLMCAERQKGILEAADRCLAPGGRLVYSTCTFSDEENEQQIEAFLTSHPDYRIERMERLYPHTAPGEGHFAALLQKAGDVSGRTEALYGSVGSRKEKKTDPRMKLYEIFVSETLTDAGREKLNGMRLSVRGDQVYAMPASFPVTDTLKVLREGLHLGTFKKARFVPSHALALYLAAEDVQRVLPLSAAEDAVNRYLRGETLPMGSDEKGYVLITVDGISLSFGHLAGGIVKNGYPKGLRR